MAESIKQGVQQVAQTLYEQHGELYPSALVEAARPKESPAHEGFEWNDKRAGHEYRLYQARSWLRKIVIQVEPNTQPERLVNVPRIVSHDGKDTREGGYQVLSVVVERPDEFERALNQAQVKMASAKQAVDELYAVAEQGNRNDQAAVIAQMAKGTALWASALSAMH